MSEGSPSGANLNRGAALASTGVAVTLVAVKAWAAWLTGSAALLGSLADTALDLVEKFVQLIHQPRRSRVDRRIVECNDRNRAFLFEANERLRQDKLLALIKL